jgi:WD40 repeat protein
VTVGLLLAAAATATGLAWPRRAPPEPPAPSPSPAWSQSAESPQARAYRLALADAGKALSAGQHDRAAEQLDGCESARRRWEWYVLRRLCVEAPAVLTLDSTDATTQGVLSQDGRRAAFLYNPSRKGTSLHLFDTGNGRPVLELPQGPAASGVQLDTLALSPDGRRLALCARDVTVTRHEPRLIEVPRRPGFGLGGPPFDPWGPMGGLRRPGIFVEVPQEVRETTIGGLFGMDVLTHEVLEDHEGGVTVAAFSPDSRLLARGSGNAVSIREGKNVSLLPGNASAPVTGLAFSPDGSLLAAGCNDGTVLLWDVKTRAQVGPPRRVEVGGIGIAVETKDGAILVKEVVPGGAAANQGTIKAGDRIVAVSGPDGTMVPMEGVPLADFLRLGRGRVGDKVLLKVRQGNQETTVEIGRAPLSNLAVLRLAFSPDGRRLAAIASASVAVWQLEKNALPPKEEALVHGVGWAVAFTPDGRLLVGREGNLVVLDSADGELCVVPGLGHVLVDLACLHDGRLGVLARAGRDLKYYLLDAAALDDRPRRVGPLGGDRRQAIRDLTATIESGKEKDGRALARLYHQRGLLLSEEGDFAAAKSDLERAFKLDPSLKDGPR